MLNKIIQVIILLIGLVAVVRVCLYAIKIVYKNTKQVIDEEDGKPYESIEDWKKEVRHLKWPVIIMVILIIIIIILINIYFPNK